MSRPPLTREAVDLLRTPGPSAPCAGLFGCSLPSGAFVAARRVAPLDAVGAAGGLRRRMETGG